MTRTRTGAALLATALTATALSVTAAAPAGAAAPTTVTIGGADFTLHGKGAARVKDAPYAKVVRLTSNRAATPEGRSTKARAFIAANAGKRVKVCVTSRSNGMTGGVNVAIVGARASKEWDTNAKKYATRCYTTTISKDVKKFAGYGQVTVSSWGQFRPVARVDYVAKVTVTKA